VAPLFFFFIGILAFFFVSWVLEKRFVLLVVLWYYCLLLWLVGVVAVCVRGMSMILLPWLLVW